MNRQKPIYTGVKNKTKHIDVLPSKSSDGLRSGSWAEMTGLVVWFRAIGGLTGVVGSKVPNLLSITATL